MRLKTARCILHRQHPDSGERSYLLAVHASFRYRRQPRWGLVGGAIEWRESPRSAALRELREELGIRLDDVIEIGDFRYKHGLHRVVAGEWSAAIPRVDRSELLEVRWFERAEISALESERALHANYELDAIDALERRLKEDATSRLAG